MKREDSHALRRLEQRHRQLETVRSYRYARTPTRVQDSVDEPQP
jgi:hypothetical protein